MKKKVLVIMEKKLEFHLKKLIEIPNISTSYEKDSEAIYTSRAFTFNNSLTKPINSSIITSYINDEENSKGIFYFNFFPMVQYNY